MRPTGGHFPVYQEHVAELRWYWSITAYVWAGRGHRHQWKGADARKGQPNFSASWIAWSRQSSTTP